jgi:hypothetical protein
VVKPTRRGVAFWLRLVCRERIPPPKAAFFRLWRDLDVAVTMNILGSVLIREPVCPRW